jgi:hypothetical protein
MEVQINESVQLLKAVFKNVQNPNVNINVRYKLKGTDLVKSVFLGISKEPRSRAAGH